METNINLGLTMNLPLWVEFFDELQNVRGRSLNTVMAYKRDLELYAEFKQTHGRISAFYEFMKQKQLSTRSQARVISSVRTYLKFVESRGGQSPELRELRPPRVKAGLPKPLSIEEFNRLMTAAEAPDPMRTTRNRITLLLLFGLGCRVSELIGMDLGDFHESERWVKVTGKGSKERLVPLTEPLFESLLLYLREVRASLVRDKTAAILINDRGHRPSRVDIWRWLSAWSAKAGFDKAVHPHQFRHGCATALLESGADLRSIQMLLGHSSIQTTQIYTNVTTQTLTRAIDEHHPLSNAGIKVPETT